jgi:SAM-dependent methyltransferase
MHDLSQANLIQFCSEIFSQEPMYERFVNEARFGLSRLLPVLSAFDLKTMQILEVGAGSCILSAYLASKRLSVTAVEPLGPEFDFFAELQARVLAFCARQSIDLKLIRALAEQLDRPGQFDVAFTINALEHMHDPLLAIDNMYASLKPGGIALLHCPNYTIPFDGHFNILLVTRSKRLNEWLYPSRIGRYPKVWDELNFIRHIDVRRHLANRRVEFTFERRVMHDLVARLLSDPIFAERMPAILHVAAGVLRSTGLLRALAFVPTRFQTPMEVVIRKS